jgi:hypothetical protein
VLINPVTFCEPEVALLPLQPPEAVQEVAFVELHVSVELPPLDTLVGFALIVTVGAPGGGGGPGGCTVTVTSWLTEPPDPVQVSEKVAVAFSTPVLAVPAVGLAPDHAPEAVQLVAPVLDQEREPLEPASSDVGVAAKVNVGAAGGTGGGSAPLGPSLPPPD